MSLGTSATTPAPGSAKKPWFKSTWFIILTLVFFAPVGSVLMWLFTRWNILVKIGATFWALIFLLLVFGSGGINSDGTGSRTQPTVAATQQESAEKTASSQTTVSQAAVSAGAKSAEPTAASESIEPGRAWMAPIAFGEAALIEEGDKEFRITITEVLRNATPKMKEINQFNPTPPDGMDYLLVKLRLEYPKGPDDQPYSTPSLGHSVMARARMWGPSGGVEPEPGFAGQDIFPGATVEGWLDAFIIPQESMDTAILFYGKGIIANTGGTWFSLGEKANVPPALPEITASVNGIDVSKARQRTSPIPFRTPALFKDGGREIEVQVTEVIRNATREVKAANQFNKDAPPDQDYLLIKMKARYIRGPEDRPWTTPSLGHSVFAQNRMWGDVGVVEPQPAFGGVDLFPGGEHEGWLNVIALPKDGMDEAILSYGKSLLGGGDTWFALK